MLSYIASSKVKMFLNNLTKEVTYIAQPETVVDGWTQKESGVTHDKVEIGGDILF
jgi:hypothetical protein